MYLCHKEFLKCWDKFFIFWHVKTDLGYMYTLWYMQRSGFATPMKPDLKEEILVSIYNFDIWAFWSLRILEFPVNTLNILYLGYTFKIFLKNLKYIFTYSFWGWEEMTHLNFFFVIQITQHNLSRNFSGSGTVSFRASQFVLILLFRHHLIWVLVFLSVKAEGCTEWTLISFPALIFYHYLLFASV